MKEWYKIYTRKEPPCEFCTKALELLRVYGKDFYQADITEDGVKQMFSEKGFRTVPQVFVEDRHIGGYLALEEHLRVEQEEKQRQHRTKSE